MQVTIEEWDGEHESACQMFDIVELCLPLQSKMDRAHVVSFLEKMRQPFPNSTLVAKKHGQVVATAMLYAGPNDRVACMVGAVHPSLRGQGVGTELLSILVGHLERYPQRRQLQANAFQSNGDGIRFLQKRGFAEVDRLHWLSRPTDLAFADWLLDKESALERSALRVVVGTEFETLRDDWDVAWWKAKTAIDADIPSAIPFAEIPFAEWKGYLSPPFLNRHHALILLDDTEPVGFLFLGEVDRGTVNINYTGIAREYRRKGLSVVLKMKAFRHALALGAHTVTTQNHEANPMLGLNRTLGFSELDVDVIFSKDLPLATSP